MDFTGTEGLKKFKLEQRLKELQNAEGAWFSNRQQQRNLMQAAASSLAYYPSAIAGLDARLPALRDLANAETRAYTIAGETVPEKAAAKQIREGMAKAVQEANEVMNPEQSPGLKRPLLAMQINGREVLIGAPIVQEASMVEQEQSKRRWTLTWPVTVDGQPMPRTGQASTANDTDGAVTSDSTFLAMLDKAANLVAGQRASYQRRLNEAVQQQEVSGAALQKPFAAQAELDQVRKDLAAQIAKMSGKTDSSVPETGTTPPAASTPPLADGTGRGGMMEPLRSSAMPGRSYERDIAYWDTAAAELSAPATDSAVVSFASGIANAPDAMGALRSKAAIGTTVQYLKTKGVYDAFKVAIANKRQVFVDSGAFSAFTKGRAMDFDAVFDRYDDLAKYIRPGSTLTLVGPDKLGDQATSAALVKQYRGRITSLLKAGARVILPIQDGPLSMREYLAATGFTPQQIAIGLPANKVGYPRQKLRAELQDAGAVDVHFLGMSAENRDSQMMVTAARSSGVIKITMDANRIRSKAGDSIRLPDPDSPEAYYDRSDAEHAYYDGDTPLPENFDAQREGRTLARERMVQYALEGEASNTLRDDPTGDLFATTPLASTGVDGNGQSGEAALPFSLSRSRAVAPTDYPESAQKVVATTSVGTLTKSLLEPRESLVLLDAEAENPMMVSPAYKAAKRLGDKQAAWKIAKLFIGKRLAEYEKALEGKMPVFVPIRQKEGERINLLPIMAAWALKLGIGRGRVVKSIHQLKKGGNTGATASERGSKKHDFTGTLILNKGETVVLVDDTFTSGNTFAAVFDYLHGQGVTPEHIFAMASGRYTKDMAASPERQQAAIDKAGVSMAEFARVTGTTINTFTGAELQAYLLNGKPGIEGFLDRFDAGRERRGGRLVRGADAGLGPRSSALAQKSPTAEDSVSRDSADAGKSNFNGTAVGRGDTPLSSTPVNGNSQTQSFRDALVNAGVDLSLLDDYADRADMETSGSRTLGNPELSLGGGTAANTTFGDPVIMGVDAYRAATVEEQTFDQWDDDAAQMLRDDYEGTVQQLISYGLTGGQLSPPLTRAAQMLVERESRLPLNPARQRRLQALVYAYRQAGTEQARGLASRRDPFKTPEERHREFLAKQIFTPPLATRKKLEDAVSKAERQRLLDQDAQRLTGPARSVLSLLDPNYSLESGKNYAFREAYVTKVIAVGGSNVANIEDGALATRIRMGIFASAYGLDMEGRAALARMAGETDDGSKKITNAMLTMAAGLGWMKAETAAGNLYDRDISTDLGAAAARIATALRERVADSPAAAVYNDLIDQPDFFDPPLVRSLIAFLVNNRSSRQKIEDALSNYVEAVVNFGKPAQQDLLETIDPPTREALWAKASNPATTTDREERHALASQALQQSSPLQSQTITAWHAGGISGSYDPQKADMDALFGPAFYAADKPSRASGYGKTKARPFTLTIDRLFDTDAAIKKQEATRIAALAGVPDSIDWLYDDEAASGTPVTGEDVWNAIKDATTPLAVNEALQMAGYDAGTYTGNRGRDRDYFVFDPARITEGPQPLASRPSSDAELMASFDVALTNRRIAGDQIASLKPGLIALVPGAEKKAILSDRIDRLQSLARDGLIRSYHFDTLFGLDYLRDVTWGPETAKVVAALRPFRDSLRFVPATAKAQTSLARDAALFGGTASETSILSVPGNAQGDLFPLASSPVLATQALQSQFLEDQAVKFEGEEVSYDGIVHRNPTDEERAQHTADVAMLKGGQRKLAAAESNGQTILRIGGETRKAVVQAVWAMQELSYKAIGLPYSDASKMMDEADTLFDVFFNEGKPVGFAIIKPTIYGYKTCCSGTDGTEAGKAAWKANFFRLQQHGFYSELSGKPLLIAMAKGFPLMRAEEAISVLEKTALIQPDGWTYERKITGLANPHVKRMVGLPWKTDTTTSADSKPSSNKLEARKPRQSYKTRSTPAATPTSLMIQGSSTSSLSSNSAPESPASAPLASTPAPFTYPHQRDGDFRDKWKVTAAGQTVRLEDGREGVVTRYGNDKDFDVTTDAGIVTQLKSKQVWVKLSPEELELEPHLITRLTTFSELNPAYSDTIRAIASVLPEAYPITAPLKGAPRALEKAAQELREKRRDEADGGKKAPSAEMVVADLADLMRGSVLVDTDEQVPLGITTLIKAFAPDAVRDPASTEDKQRFTSNGLTIIIENRFSNPTKAGYSDVQVKIEVMPGHFAELQIHIPEMLAAKEGNEVKEMGVPEKYWPENLNIEKLDPANPGHKLYEVARSLLKENPLLAALEAKMRELYRSALAAAARRKASSRVNSLIQGSSPVNGGAAPRITPVGTTTQPLPPKAATVNPVSFTQNVASAGTSAAGTRSSSSFITGYYSSLFEKKQGVVVTAGNIEDYRGTVNVDNLTGRNGEWKKAFKQAEGMVLVPLSKLVSRKDELQDPRFLAGLKADPRQTAGKFIGLALDGQADPRAPLDVYPGENGTYEITDGNATAQTLMLAGWKTVPVIVRPAAMAPLASRPAPSSNQGDLFAEWANTLPPVAKTSKPAFVKAIKAEIPAAIRPTAPAAADLFNNLATNNYGPQGNAPGSDGRAELSGPSGGTPAGPKNRRGPKAPKTVSDDLFDWSAAIQGGNPEQPGLGGSTGSDGSGTRGGGSRDGISKQPAGGKSKEPADGVRGDSPGRDGLYPVNPEPADEADRNHRIDPNEKVAPRTDSAKWAGNFAAMKLLRELDDAGRNPTPAEKSVLEAYTGWGWMKEAFNDVRAKAYDQLKSRYDQTFDANRGPNDWEARALAADPDRAQNLISWNNTYGGYYAQLREELTAKEFRSAAKSVRNAHFTTPSVIGAMWSAVARLGFKGGRAMEPGAGIGHFIGVQPEEMAKRTRWEATELDDVTARIISKLYPEARVNGRMPAPNREVSGMGFQDSRIPNNSLDLFISNVPFAKEGPGKAKSEFGQEFNLHNYFFARSLAKVKPGGLVVFITSNGTMENQRAQRAYLNKIQ